MSITDEFLCVLFHPPATSPPYPQSPAVDLFRRRSTARLWTGHPNSWTRSKQCASTRRARGEGTTIAKDISRAQLGETQGAGGATQQCVESRTAINTHILVREARAQGKAKD
ncbi:hypothetical protein GSI_04953 [Ganoderma sinense ZZ0214-1]|uniref:Uncharacterized protein n=1 Tax=Ganoderma sinense ZZ0214-1 TaxID=1077348 RepID=A0A2G8SGE2_9APHY|nr:hypothetical protein GSI_04953 [Ganoderma sinense ZZ0214-1]